MSKSSPSRPRAKPTARRASEDTPLALRPVRWLQSLLRRRVRLERRGLQLHVLLDPATILDTTDPGTSAGEALRRAHAELGALLDRHPEARHLLRHLGYLERAIAQSGSRAFRQVPVRVLGRALEQLDLLLRDERGDAITPLRLRIERALAERAANPGPDTQPQALQVSEASQSLFDEMERSWTGRMPLEASPTGDRRRGS